MLKTLSLSPDENRDEAVTDDSASRMMRALEALSSQPQPREANQGSSPNPASPNASFQGQPNGAFRPNKPASGQDGHRGEGFRQDGYRTDGFRNDGPHHSNKARHRFVKDGEVPVVHMPKAGPRDAASSGPARNDPEYARLHQIIEDQRQRGDQAERARAEAQAQCKLLQTKFAHAELALADAQALAQARLEEITALQAQLQQLQAPPPAPRAPAPVSPDAPPKRRPGRPRRIVVELPTPEPEPVEWWLLPAKNKRRA